MFRHHRVISDQQIAWTIQGEVLTAFNEFAKEFIEIVFKDEVNPDVIDIPVKVMYLAKCLGSLFVTWV